MLITLLLIWENEIISLPIHIRFGMIRESNRTKIKLIK